MIQHYLCIDQTNLYANKSTLIAVNHTEFNQEQPLSCSEQWSIYPRGLLVNASPSPNWQQHLAHQCLFAETPSGCDALGGAVSSQQALAHSGLSSE